MKRMLPLFAASIILLTGVPLVLAADPTGSGVILLEPSVVNKTEGARVQFGEYMSTLFTTFIAIAAALAVLMIVWGGIEYISSFSGSGKEQGKERITNAVFGLILAVSAFLILQTINPDLISSGTLNLDIGKLPDQPVYASNGTGDEEYQDEGWGLCTEKGFEKCQLLYNYNPWYGQGCSGLDGAEGGIHYKEAPPRSCTKPIQAPEGSTESICCGVPLTPDKQAHIYLSQVNNTNCYRGPFGNKAECDTAHNQDTTGGRSDCQPISNRIADPAPYCTKIESGAAVTPQSESEVRQRLSQAGIQVNRANGCYNRDGTPIRYKEYSQLYGSGGCTTVGTLPSYAIDKAIALKNNCGGCELVITGGSEFGHITHGPGRPIVDLRKGDTLDTYIKSKAVKHQQTSKGIKYFMDDGSTFLDETGGTPHWHVVFTQ